MLAFPLAFIISLFLSSVPVFSHLILLPRHDNIEENNKDISSSAEGSKTVRIDIKVEREDSYSENTGSCRKEDTASCPSSTTNRYGFRCGKKFYSQARVLAAAKVACPRISRNSQWHAFPAPYSYSKYEKPGPYVEWPIKRDGMIWNMGSRDKRRLVMTMDCAVVGAVIRHKKEGTYSQCRYERQ